MKTLRTLAITGGLLLACTGIQAQDEGEGGSFTGNIGFLSDYVFRGIFQAESAANGGVDYETGPFYVGTWAADVGMGAEVDLYLGFAGEIGDFNYGVGATGYYYTDDFDDTYQELNLNAGYGILSFSANFGQYENFDEPIQDYSFYSISAEGGGFYGTIGSFAQDFDGEYYELGYGTEVAGIDLGLSAIYSDEMLAGGTSGETTVVFSIAKTFTIR